MNFHGLKLLNKGSKGMAYLSVEIDQNMALFNKKFFLD